MKEISDYLIVGAGIVGLSVAREIKSREPNAKIRILEKESRLGVHASGRNSGVLHTGIYYPHGTLKARLCKAGADEMFAYAQKYDIPVRRDGKVIVATSEENANGIDKLLANAAANNIRANRVNADEIRQIEPHARAEFGGIHCQDTAVIDSPRLLEVLHSRLTQQGVQIDTDQMVTSINDEQQTATTQSRTYSYGTLINAAGAYADRVARFAGVGQHYQLVPFKGLYYKLVPEVTDRVRGSIYSVPNPALPFLGIHFTRVISNEVYIGPTAIPALGRENYGMLSGAKLIETFGISGQLARLYATNPQNFRNLVHSEMLHYRKHGFLAAARQLVDRLEPDWVISTPKVGIRPQLVNTREGRLEMDFVVERGGHSVHVLNAISPAFTSAFAFAAYIVDKFSKRVRMDIKGKKIVVVGGAGLIGSHTIDHLLKEDVKEILIYDNFVRGRVENLNNALKDPRVKIFDVGGDVMQTDILEAAFDGADGVFHLAALWLLQCHDYPRSAFDVNVRGTFNVMEACVKKGVKRLVYSSSASVYGDAMEEPMTEDHPFNNKNFYGATKIAGEAMLRAFHHRYGLDYVGLRYMNVYGPRQDYHGAYIAVIMKMLDAIDRGEGPTIMGDGSEAFDFVAVEDCGLANVCAMKADATDRYYNVGTGKRTSLRELAELILEITGCKKSINFASRSQATLVRNRVGSAKRASAEIGFTSRLDLREGLKQLIEWRANHKAEVEARRRAVGLSI